MLQADGYAARNIEARLDDTEIGRFMKYTDVRKVLIKRTVALRRSRDMTIDDVINEGWFNSRHLQGICKKGMRLE